MWRPRTADRAARPRVAGPAGAHGRLRLLAAHRRHRRVQPRGRALRLAPTFALDEARRRGRYALENDEHVNVLVARSVPTIEGEAVAFADLWTRRQAARLVEGVHVQLPSLADLILTKQFAARPKDLEDIRLLEILRHEEGR